MSCNDVASILVNQRRARLAPAERARVDEHLAACADCAAAWHADTELHTLLVPPVPATLLERALLASRLPQSAPVRRARASLVVGGLALAGVAAAAVTIVSLTTPSPSTPSASPAAAPPSIAQDAPSNTPIEHVDADRSSDTDGQPISVEFVKMALSFQPIVRKAPDYPPDALKRGLEGDVQLKFDVTAAGTVENISVVRSSDALFEDPAIRALAGWRYLPRIAAGKRVGSEGIHTIIRFAMAKDDASAKPLSDEAAAAAMREWTAFNASLEVAMDRLAANDLRGVELQLDEMQAIFGADRADLWSFYGYLYTVQANYGRAIDAYEMSVAAYARENHVQSAPYVPLASLYFARHQYDMALKTLLRPNLPGGNRIMSPEANALLEQLNALGVTEQTVR